jgi:hypothetical protein
MHCLHQQLEPRTREVRIQSIWATGNTGQSQGHTLNSAFHFRLFRVFSPLPPAALGMCSTVPTRHGTRRGSRRERQRQAPLSRSVPLAPGNEGIGRRGLGRRGLRRRGLGRILGSAFCLQPPLSRSSNQQDESEGNVFLFWGGGGG